MATKSAIGTVKELVVENKILRIKLEGAGEHPTEHFFMNLPSKNEPEAEGHSKNYNAAYSLVLAAAVNRFPLFVRARDTFTAQSVQVEIDYVAVTW